MSATGLVGSLDPAAPGGPARLLATADRVLAPTYRQPPRIFVRGEGAWLEDAGGQRFLDMTGGVAVLALGHASPVVAAAIHDAADGPIHVSNLFYTAPPIALAAALVERSFADRVFFANSGAEAVEGALKLARRWGGPARRTIVCFDGAFHGRTLGALAATDRPDDEPRFGPLPGGFRRAPWNDPAALEAVAGDTAAVIVEPVQGEAGVRVADAAWLVALRRRCDEAGALLIFDEVQSGLGRTGHLWAHEFYDVQPDLMSLAKPLAGGLPMGAVLMTERVAAALRPGDHASTFGGGPFVASVALAVLETIAARSFLERVRRRGAWLRDWLGALSSPLIRGIRGRGLLVGVRLVGPTERVRQAAFEEGLLLVPAGDDVLRFLPPLDVSEAVLGEAVDRFARALARAEAEPATSRTEEERRS